MSYIIILTCCIISLGACTGPVIIEEENRPNDKTEQEGTPPTRDSVTIVHEGTYTSPYSIAEAQTLGRGKSVWVEGYIVGCVSGPMKSGCNFTANATTTSNILLADTFLTGAKYDYLYCMPIELPNNSFERDELNLYDTPDNYHRRVRIQGDITLYYKVAGIKGFIDYAFGDNHEDENEDLGEEENEEEEEEQPEKPDIPNKPNNPDATRQDTLSIAEGIRQQGEQVYIRGYIVGFYNSSSSKIRFNPTPEQINSRAENNIVLADHIDETNSDNVIIVDLPSKTALRQQANLKDNPQNLHHIITVKGRMRNFRETDFHGCMDTQSKYLDDEDYYFSIE